MHPIPTSSSIPKCSSPPVPLTCYFDRGSNYVRGSLNWGPLTWINEVAKTYGWWTQRRQSYADGFHTYALEWSPDFLYVTPYRDFRRK